MSFAIISRMVKSKFFSLPNLLADKALVPEVLQKQVTAEELGQQLLPYVEDEQATQALLDEFDAIHRQLRCNASEKAAVAVLKLIGKDIISEVETS